MSKGEKKHKFTQEERERIVQIMEEKIMNEDDDFVYEVLELMLSNVIEEVKEVWEKVVEQVEGIFQVVLEEVVKAYDKLEEEVSKDEEQ